MKAFQDPVFLRALANTALYAIIVIPFGVFLALGVALLVYNRKRSRTFGKWPISFPSPQPSSPWRPCGSFSCTLRLVP